MDITRLRHLIAKRTFCDSADRDQDTRAVFHAIADLLDRIPEPAGCPKCDANAEAQVAEKDAEPAQIHMAEWERICEASAKFHRRCAEHQDEGYPGIAHDMSEKDAEIARLRAALGRAQAAVRDAAVCNSWNATLRVRMNDIALDIAWRDFHAQAIREAEEAKT